MYRFLAPIHAVSFCLLQHVQSHTVHFDKPTTTCTGATVACSLLSSKATKIIIKTHPQLHLHLTRRLGCLPLHAQLLCQQPHLVCLAHIPTLHFSHGCICQQPSPHLHVCLALVCLTLLPGGLSIMSLCRQPVTFAVSFLKRLYEGIGVLLGLLVCGEQNCLIIGCGNHCCIYTLHTGRSHEGSKQGGSRHGSRMKSLCCTYLSAMPKFQVLPNFRSCQYHVAPIFELC